MDDYTIGVLTNIGLFSFLALSAYLLLVAGEMSFGQQAFFGVGAYSGGILTAIYGLPLPLAALAAMGLGAGAAALVGLPTLPEAHATALANLFQVRNEYLHYKWSGKDPDLLATSEPRLTGAIAEIEATVSALRDYDMTLLDPHIPVAEALMEQPIRELLRRVYDPEPGSVVEA